MNTNDANKTIANKWIAAFNDHDLEALLLLYDENAVHFSPKLKLRQPETGGWVKGNAGLRKWWADAFDRLPSLHYELKNLLVDDTQVLMEYQRTVESEPSMMVAEILEVNDGCITKSRVYHG